jgi:ribosome biogenesis GTPase A
VLSLREILDEYLIFQEEIIVRRTRYDLKKAQERDHLLQGLLIAQDNIDEVIKIIRASYDDAKENLMARFGLSDVQAQAILDMRLKALQGLDREKLEAEHKELLEKIAYFERVLSDPELVKSILKEQMAKWAEKGMSGRPVRVMVVGVPNVGKSTFINKVANRKSAIAQNRPGVTRGKQWVSVDQGLDLLDTPGILWPKFEDKTVGLHLAFTGAVKDTVLDTETLALHLMRLLMVRYPEALEERYRIEIPEEPDAWELVEEAGRKRGFLISGGEVDTERMSRILLEEFRSGKLGRFTLELPPEEAAP